jgi:hypothetical protein
MEQKRRQRRQSKLSERGRNSVRNESGETAMIKRSVPLLLLLVLFAVALSRRSAAYDFHGWREDGTSRFGSSIGQQSTHQAFNLYEDFIDPAFGSFALYWKGELQGNGGNTNPPFGDVPPTADLVDTREQDLDIPWASWGPVTNKVAAPPVPKLTPNLPQAWGPIEMDLDPNNQGADHLLLAVNFQPPRVGASQFDREQVLNAYYPQTYPLGTNDPLPGNQSALAASLRGRVQPLWRKDPADAQHPGLRIRDLEPLDGTDTNGSAR